MTLYMTLLALTLAIVLLPGMLMVYALLKAARRADDHAARIAVPLRGRRLRGRRHSDWN